VLGRLLEGARLLIPLSSVGTQALEALLCPLLVEAGERNGLATRVDAFHQVLVWHQLGLAAERYERLNPRPSAR
jgi:hypothetical protein